MTLMAFPHPVSVTEAAARGVSKLVRDAEAGDDVVVERHGRAVAAVVGMRRLAQIQRLEADLHDSGYSIVDVRDVPDRPGHELLFLARRSS